MIFHLKQNNNSGLHIIGELVQFGILEDIKDNLTETRASRASFRNGNFKGHARCIFFAYELWRLGTIKLPFLDNNGDDLHAVADMDS